MQSILRKCLRFRVALPSFAFMSCIILCGIFIIFKNSQYHVNLYKDKWSNASSNVEQEKTENLSVSLQQKIQISVLKSGKTFANGIPKIVHYIYKSENVPEQYVEFIKNCIRLNSDMTFFLWTDDSGYKFAQDVYAGPIFEKYKTYTVGIEKSDLLRLLIIHHIGGVYMDMDVECRKSLTKSLPGGTTCLMDQEMPLQTQAFWSIPYTIMNSVMVCQPKHPFFQMAIDRVKPDYKEETVKKTGPLFLQKVYDDYLDDRKRRNLPYMMDKPDYRLFSPLAVPYMLPFCARFALRKASVALKGPVAGCPMYEHLVRNLREQDMIRNSIGVHRFLHLGTNAKAIKKLVNLLKMNLKIEHIKF